MTTSYTVQFRHHSSEPATSQRQARRIVRRAMGQARMRAVSVPDGIYCYRTAADMRRDDTGERAFAVIVKN